MTQDEGTERSVGGLALPIVLAGASAVIALLLTMKPKRLRAAMATLTGGADDLVGDLRKRAESVAGGRKPQTGSGGGGDSDEFEKRRRERRERRERRRRHATR